MGESLESLPDVVQRYQDAHDRHDVDATPATFTDDAVAHDKDQEWVGAEQIRQWRAKTNTEYKYTRLLLGVESAGVDAWLVRNRLEGNFPGNVVDLNYQFTLDGDRISRLTIAP